MVNYSKMNKSVIKSKSNVIYNYICCEFFICVLKQCCDEQKSF